ncbi:MAG TPA: hypothetical protein VHO70_07365 [Chitinispirillaceae bacterium]|nr:hypothetical protein [Chitinispirillaceae bacterium]
MIRLANSLLIVATVFTTVFAQPSKGVQYQTKKQNVMMMGNDSTGMMNPMMGMGMLMKRDVIPVADGIIVVLGNKLLKYDNNLNLKQELLLQLDERDMRMMVEQMQKMRSIYQEMMRAEQGQQR